MIRVANKMATVAMFAIVAGKALAAEHDLGVGYEPVVSADRVVASNDSTKRVQVLWTTGIDVIRTYSNDLGASWATAATFPGGVGNWIDPIAACNIFGSQSPRHMYFGWYAQTGVDAGDRFNRSISDGNVDNTVVAQAQGGG